MTDVQVSAGERGATRIADRVVAKVAAQAAREALRRAREGGGKGTGEAGKGDGRPAGGPPVSRPVRRTSVTVRERTARVRLGLELGYPSDIGAQCGAVRRRVISRVGELVGMDVPDVAVEIERLHSAQLKGDGSGRVK
ncbi:Asp23/Gls24 family envelope stress response protein [Streptomyces oryzae]|uniref:Asp23/Gls24 family envelope stress response protein n=1 Tax=Streptomyces oryzae TaxID=1434886 RepID=A0ABS3X662_9ACTN|nr:Asp23/Gls24 family envelope stress response protein [Streptomyces oryzae]MBO8190858.1 Asp23/Gls24 family envelope stress response protein [Streptomyces oryzae]